MMVSIIAEENFMENQAKTNDSKAIESKPEWVKPEVTEFDVKSTTQSGGTSATLDSAGYS
jgi:hypothetical protein